MLCELVAAAKRAVVAEVVRRRRCGGRGPQHGDAAQGGERGARPRRAAHDARRRVALMDGYISYPRTESTAYPPGGATTARRVEHPEWGVHRLAVGRQHGAAARRRRGRPPADRAGARGDERAGWLRRLAGVLVHRQAVLGEPVPRREAATTKRRSRRRASASAARAPLVDAGWLGAAAPRAGGGSAAGASRGREACVASAARGGRDGGARPISEAELIGAMEAHGIGTDASIPQHIGNIEARRYAKMGPGRRLSPTPLGLALIQCDRRIDPELVLPTVRSHVERQLELVAKGEARRAAVVAHCLGEFRLKFDHLVRTISRMDELFEASFGAAAAATARAAAAAAAAGAARSRSRGAGGRGGTSTLLSSRPARLQRAHRGGVGAAAAVCTRSTPASSRARAALGLALFLPRSCRASAPTRCALAATTSRAARRRAGERREGDARTRCPRTTRPSRRCACARARDGARGRRHAVDPLGAPTGGSSHARPHVVKLPPFINKCPSARRAAAPARAASSSSSSTATARPSPTATTHPGASCRTNCSRALTESAAEAPGSKGKGRGGGKGKGGRGGGKGGSGRGPREGRGRQRQGRRQGRGPRREGRPRPRPRRVLG